MVQFNESSGDVTSNKAGRRAVLGMAIGPSEAETFWTDVLRKLARRGLRGITLVVSDVHEGQGRRVVSAAHAQSVPFCWSRTTNGPSSDPAT